MRPALGKMAPRGQLTPWVTLLVLISQVAFQSALARAEYSSSREEPSQHRRLAGFGFWAPKTEKFFDASKRALRRKLENIEHGRLYTKSHAEYCAFYESTQLTSLCGSRAGILPSPSSCCKALHAFLDEGKCMCDPKRFTLPQTPNLKNLLQFKSICIGFGFRRVRFRVPRHLTDLWEDDQCKPFTRARPAGMLNPAFLFDPLGRRIPVNPPPLFDRLYKPPSPGPYDVSNIEVTLDRSTKSVLNHSFSTELKFKAQIFYPSNKKRETLDADRNVIGPVLAQGNELFSVIAFSMGLGDSLSWHRRKLTHLASYGFVVVVPLSGSGTYYPIPERHLEAWSDDLVTALEFAKARTQDRASFLHRRLRVDRYGIAGVSAGAAAAFIATYKARSVKGHNAVALAAIATPCNHAGNQCSRTVEAARLLKGVHILFASGTQDGVSPTKVTGFLIEEVPKESDVYGLYLDGMTHCFSELDPAEWPLSTNECGLGNTPPQKGISTLAENLGRFFTKTLNSDEIADIGRMRLRG